MKAAEDKPVTNDDRETNPPRELSAASDVPWEFELLDRLGITITSDDEFSRLLDEQDARSLKS